MRVQFRAAKPSAQARAVCAGCGLHAWLQPADLEPADEEKIEALSEHRRPIKRDHYLIHAGAPLERLYFVNSGSLKSTVPDADGRLQLIGFSLPGEIVGMGAIGTPDDICEQIDKLVAQSNGGFGAFLMLTVRRFVNDVFAQIENED